MWSISNSKISIVFYIGSSHIKGALVDFREDEKPKVVLVEEEDINIAEGLDYSHLPRLMARAVERLSNRLIESDVWKEGSLKVENIHCVFSPLWYSSKVKNIIFDEDEEFLFSEDDLEEAISQMKKEAEKEEGFDKDLLIEQKGIQVELNGYPVENPYNKRASKVRINIFLSSVSRKAYDVLRETLGRLFNEREIYYHSSAMSNYSVVTREIADRDKFLIIEVDGEITQVLMVRNENISRIATFPLGVNYFVRALKKDSDDTNASSFSKLEMFAGGELEEKEHDRVEGRISRESENWIKDLQNIFQKSSRDLAVPSSAYLISGHGMLKWWSSLIKDERLAAYNLMDEPLKVEKLRSYEVAGLVHWRNQAVPDSVLAVCVSYVNYYGA